ncbi:MAG TPA: serine hydrolase [Thermaerobacter sp.]
MGRQPKGQGRRVRVRVMVALAAAALLAACAGGAKPGPGGAGNRAPGLSASTIPVVDEGSGDTLARLSELLERAETRQGVPRPDYGPLRAEVARFIAGRPQSFGIYFKDLQTGATWGINERAQIHAASTIKVPLVLYVNRQVAAGKARMDDRVVFRPEDVTGGAGILQRDGYPSASYSLRVLTNLSITISDNVTTNMLFRHFGKDDVGRFMRELGGEVIFPGGRRISTARDMGIYVEAVLDFARRHPLLGARILDDMAHSIFHVGLPGMLPDDVLVAHKEGDIEGVANDVGIVFSSRPFILSILSENVPDIDRGFEDIARISKIVYDYQEKLGPVR